VGVQPPPAPPGSEAEGRAAQVVTNYL